MYGHKQTAHLDINQPLSLTMNKRKIEIILTMLFSDSANPYLNAACSVEVQIAVRRIKV
jgi:hypothetical protein